MAQYIRIAKGEIGPDASMEEIITMMQTIDNRQSHPSIRDNLQDPGCYDTLRYPNHDYALSPTQQARFEEAFSRRGSVANEGFLGWSTSNSAFQDNPYFTWTAIKKVGKHYYYRAQPNS